ncbi:MAG: sigma-70 family RNA polymerase sigma factor [Nocardioidaceae bacterium]|nr:sigma-70 family RNA polymerase sigma factor [Nocardioidaceae bacterium]
MASSADDRHSAAAPGLAALCVLVERLVRSPVPAGGPVPARIDVLLNAVHGPAPTPPPLRRGGGGGAHPAGGGERHSGADREVVVELVRRSQRGDADAFGQLYDRYEVGVYRFCYHRTSSVSLAEDLTSETFFRALRAIDSFRWQGRDFGAWLTTIARNLITDHYKSSRARLETVIDGLPEQRDHAPGPEDIMVTQLTHETLAAALRELPDEQRDCVVMRFLQGLSIAETAQALERSPGAVKQLQLRAVRSLARNMGTDLR